MNRPTEMNFLTEKGLYKYLLKSDSPTAEEFQDWVFDRLCEMKLQIIINKDLEIKIANDKIKILRDNLQEMTISIYDDTRIDSCPRGLSEFYIARFIAKQRFTNGKLPFSRENISDDIADSLYHVACQHYKKDQQEFREIVDETLEKIMEKQKI